MNKLYIFFALFLSINSVYGQILNRQNVEYTNSSINYDVLIYPNPVVDNNFHIKSEQVIKSVELMNVLGENIKTIHNETEIAYNISVELANAEKGIYMLRLIFANEKVMIKKIVLK